MGFSLVVASGGSSLVAVGEHLIMEFSLVAEYWLEGTQALVAARVGSVAVAHWLWSRGSIVVATCLVTLWHVGSFRIRDQNLTSPALAAGFFTNESLGKPMNVTSEDKQKAFAKEEGKDI